MSHHPNAPKVGGASCSLIREQDAPTTFKPKLRFPEFRDAPGWISDNLDTVAEFVGERIPLDRVKVENYVSTENILPDFSGVTTASKLPSTGSVTHFRINDILISNIRPYLKKVWFSNKDGGSSNDVIVVRAKAKLLIQFLPFILKNDSFIDYIMTGAKGVKMPRGDVSLIKKYPITYPNHLEQQKIADCLSSLDESITAHALKLDALKTHKKSLMQQLFPCEGEAQPRLRFPEFQDAPEWGTKMLEDVVESIKTGKLDANAMVEDGEYRFYTCAKNYYKIDCYAFEGEALLIAGNGAHLGYIHHYIGKFNAYQRTYVLQEFGGNVGFLRYFLERNLPARISLEKKDGNTPYIVMSTITEMPLVIPKDDDEERQIADCLSSLDDLIAAQTDKLDALKLHKKGLMQQLFPCREESENFEMRSEKI